MYSIKKVKGGYLVITTATGKPHSSHPLTKKMAEKQLLALRINAFT
jgi:hypothetical protein